MTALCNRQMRKYLWPLLKIRNYRLAQYSDWYRKSPSSSPVIAEMDDEPYRTTVTMDNLVDGEYLHVARYSTFGFKLNNGFRIMGPCALFPKTVLHWNVTGVEDINMDALSLFTILEPKLDLLVIGVGEAGELKHISKDLYRSVRQKGINLEMLPTHQACATFNVLNGEKRCVAAALLPPRRMKSRFVDEMTWVSDNLLNPINPDRKQPISAEELRFHKMIVESREEHFAKLARKDEALGYWDHGVVKEPKEMPSETEILEQLEAGQPNTRPQLEDSGTKADERSAGSGDSSSVRSDSRDSESAAENPNSKPFKPGDSSRES